MSCDSTKHFLLLQSHLRIPLGRLISLREDKKSVTSITTPTDPGVFMCGIAAFFSSDKPVSTEALRCATRALHHRGPDSQGSWLSRNKRVALGHARLSIIDLRTGDQPIANEDERIHIIVNGEFYDFERQRRELEYRGHQFRTRSDSEVALHMYEEFGVHSVQYLRGEFAFVLWDDRNQTLFGVRDRFGIKPLYYAVHDGTLCLASEIKALVAA